MSDNVTSFGVMVPLAKPVGDHRTESHQGFSEWLDELGLYINNEGTLLFSEQTDEEGCGIFFSDPEYRDNVANLCKENNIGIIENEMQFYVSNWYNGTDSHQSDIDLETFRKSLGQ